MIQTIKTCLSNNRKEMHQKSEYKGARIYLAQFSLFSDFSVISLGYLNYLKINLLKQMLPYI